MDNSEPAGVEDQLEIRAKSNYCYSTERAMTLVAIVLLCIETLPHFAKSDCLPDGRPDWRSPRANTAEPIEEPVNPANTAEPTEMPFGRLVRDQETVRCPTTAAWTGAVRSSSLRQSATTGAQSDECCQNG